MSLRIKVGSARFALGIAAFLSLVAVAIVAPDQSDSAFRGKNGSIIFSLSPAGTPAGLSALYEADPETGKLKQLIPSGDNGGAEHPGVAPDGDTVAYWRLRNGCGELRILQISRRRSSPLSTPELCSYDPSFAPGGKIFFVGCTDERASETITGYDCDIYRIFQSGGTPVPITHIGDTMSDAAVSPNGRTIAFQVGADREGNVYSVPSSGGNAKSLVSTGIAYSPTFSPDGRRILFVYRRGSGKSSLAETPARGGSLKVLFSCGCFHPVFSPDGKRIAVEIHQDLWKVSPDGKVRRKVAEVSSARLTTVLGIDWARKG